MCCPRQHIWAEYILPTPIVPWTNLDRESDVRCCRSLSSPLQWLFGPWYPRTRLHSSWLAYHLNQKSSLTAFWCSQLIRHVRGKQSRFSSGSWSQLGGCWPSWFFRVYTRPPGILQGLRPCNLQAFAAVFVATRVIVILLIILSISSLGHCLKSRS